MKNKKMEYQYSYKVTWRHVHAGTVRGIVSFIHYDSYIADNVAKLYIMKKLIEDHGIERYLCIEDFELLWCEEYYLVEEDHDK